MALPSRREQCAWITRLALEGRVVLGIVRRRRPPLALDDVELPAAPAGVAEAPLHPARHPAGVPGVQHRLVEALPPVQPVDHPAALQGDEDLLAGMVVEGGAAPVAAL